MPFELIEVVVVLLDIVEVVVIVDVVASVVADETSPVMIKVAGIGLSAFVTEVEKEIPGLRWSL